MHRHLKLDKVATQHADGSVTYHDPDGENRDEYAKYVDVLEQMHGGGPRD